jgi:hypothetical protein
MLGSFNNFSSALDSAQVGDAYIVVGGCKTTSTADMRTDIAAGASAATSSATLRRLEQLETSKKRSLLDRVFSLAHSFQVGPL